MATRWRIYRFAITRRVFKMLCVCGDFFATLAYGRAFVCANLRKIFIALLFIIAGISGHFIDLLNIEMNADIIGATMQSDKREIGDYLTARFALHLGLFVGIPLVLLCLIRTKKANLKSALLQKVRLFLLCVSLYPRFMWHKGKKSLSHLKIKS